MSSGIEGRGLFATADLPAGVVILRLSGHLVSTDELAKLIEQANADPLLAYVDTLPISEDVHLVLSPGSVAHFGNHSCDPNLWHVGPYEIATRRAVANGGELAIDYGTQSGAADPLDVAVARRESGRRALVPAARRAGPLAYGSPGCPRASRLGRVCAHGPLRVALRISSRDGPRERHPTPGGGVLLSCKSLRL